MPAILVGLVAFVVLAVAILSAVGASRTRRLYQAEKEDLLRRAQSAPPSRADAGAASRLPAPVQKYLRVTGAVGKTVFRTVILRQTGAIRTAADKPWMPFEAEQVYSMAPSGFLWLARARVAPLVGLWARDKFVDGRGNMLVRLLGVFTVVDGKGVLTAWSGHTTNWKTIDGRLFPTHWESVWHLEEGDLTAVKIDILSVRTD